MSFRPPSLGFLYLVAAVACFIGFFAYIMRPMWWELESEEQRNLAEAAYLERIVDGAPKGKQAPWLTDSLRMYVAGQDLPAAEASFRRNEKQREMAVFSTNRVNAVPLQYEPSFADLAGRTSAPSRLPETPYLDLAQSFDWRSEMSTNAGVLAQAAHMQQQALIQEQVVRMCWTSMRNGQGAVRAVDEEWQLFDLKRGEEAIVERVVPPKSAVLLEVRVASQVSEDPSTNLGMRLVRAEVQS
ncbi:MAG TPA: hypothetical protein EYP98_00165 [Planctomycetes bacterium]|nr:hypothetical protein [Planctomycetota bacterium]